MNPVARRLAGSAPWWVVLETTGRHSGKPRQVPLARGPTSEGSIWLIAVHGRHSSWVKNLEASSEVSIKLGGRWHRARPSLVPFDARVLKRFSRYARLGPKAVGIDPALVRLDFIERGP
jgi:deazaflavin-dependent oxidoreductase (nitroreductase family)